MDISFHKIQGMSADEWANEFAEMLNNPMEDAGLVVLDSIRPSDIAMSETYKQKYARPGVSVEEQKRSMVERTDRFKEEAKAVMRDWISITRPKKDHNWIKEGF